MKRTFQRPFALLLALVMVLGLLPAAALAEGETPLSGDTAVDNTGWTDAGWGGLEPTITSESDGSLKVEVTDPGTTSWYSVAIQKTLGGVDGAGSVTMNYTGDGGTDPTQFEAYLGGGDPWVQYKATGTNSNGTVTFTEFFKKIDDSNFESDASDLSDFSPTQFVIVIGGNAMLPSLMTLSDITITAPAAKTDCTVTLVTTGDKEGAEDFTKSAFSVDGTNPVSGTSLTVASGTTITVLGKVWPDSTDNNKADYLQSVTVNGTAKTDVQAGKDYTVTITGDTTLTAGYKWSETPPTVETQCTVTFNATEDGSPKGDPAENFTKAAFSVDGTTPVSDTSLTVASGTKITVLGKVWPDGTDANKADYLDSVTVNNQVQPIAKGQNFEITVSDANTTIAADYKYLTAPPAETTNCTVTLSATETGMDASQLPNLTTAAFQGENGGGIASGSFPSGTKIVVQGKVWADASDPNQAHYLDSVTVNGNAQTIAKGQNYTVTVTGSVTVVAGYKWSATPPSTDPPGETYTLTLNATASGNPVELGSEAADAKGSTFRKQAFTGGITWVEPACTQAAVSKGAEITITGVIWPDGTKGQYLESLTIDGQTPDGFVPYQEYKVTINKDTTINADYLYSETKPVYTPKPSLAADENLIAHIVPWSADGWITASGQTSAGYVYLKHVGGVFDTTTVREDGTFGLLYQTDTASPESKLFLSVSSNSDDSLPWARVSPTKTESVDGYTNWYRSEFSVAAVKAAFGSSFGYMDQIGVWILDGLHLNAREAKLYYVDGTGAFVETASGDAITGFPWKNQSHKYDPDGGIALIGDSIVHNPRVNSDVGLSPDKGDWNAILGRENCDNYGIGGEQSQHIAARFAELTENGDYRQIVTLFGINNLGTGTETQVIERVIADYTTVLNTAKAAVNSSGKKLEKVFVISLLPSTPLTYEGAQLRIQHVNAQLKALCESDPYKDFVTFVNVYPELLYKGDAPLTGCAANGHDNDGNTFTGYEPHGDPMYFFPSDGLHPNAAGYAEIARVLNPLLGGTYSVTQGVTGDATSFNTNGWVHGGDGWTNGGTSTGSLSVTKDGMLDVRVRFNNTNWSQTAISNWSNEGHTTGANDMISMDVYLEKSAVDASQGTMLAQVYEFGSAVPLNTSGTAVKVNGADYYKTALNIKGTFPSPFQNFAILFVARNSAFNGNILVNNIAFQKSSGETVVKVEGSGNFSKDANGTDMTVNIEQGETAQTPPYSNSGHTGRLNKGAKIKLTIKLNNVGDNLGGSLKATVTITGTNGVSRNVETTVNASAFLADAAPKTATVEIDIPDEAVNAVENVKTVSVKAESADKTTGNAFNYNGALDLTELIITNGPADITSPYADNGGGSGGGGGGGGSSSTNYSVTIPYTWTFSRDQGWKYDRAWNSDYSGAANTSATERNGYLTVNADYSKNGDKSWSQMAVTLWHENGMNISGATHASLELYYLPQKLNGELALKLFSNAGIDATASIDWDEAEEVQIGEEVYQKVRAEFNFTEVRSNRVQDLAICIIGRNTTYRGTLLIDNLTLDKEGTDPYVKSTLKPAKNNSRLSLSGKTLKTASGETVSIPSQVTMADGGADENARALYAYLKAIGDSKDVLFGQQNNFLNKAGASDLSDADTYDVAGDYAAVFGLDGLALAGNEFSASRCNERYGTSYPNTAAGHVAASAYVSNKAIERGAVVTLSLHIPNFSVVSPKQSSEAETYAHYDFSGYTPNTLTGDVVNELFPGGKYNEVFTAYLDMVADYAKQVDGAVLFRPFHENTGSWFWWGKAFCDPSTYQNVFRYTVEYLRDIKGVHNFIYVYGPGSEAESVEDYAERYPGDSWVDMVGFDMYNSAPDAKSGWMQEFEKELDLVNRFAKSHGKLIAVTETGAANATAKGDSQTALLKSGNKDLDWYNRVLNVVSKSSASYFLTWANFGQNDGFYTPYVLKVNGDGSLYGHEMMDHFIRYYNDSRSVFAADQKGIVSGISGVTAAAVNSNAEGYIISPISGRRILEATEFVARMTNAKSAQVQFVLHGGNKTVTLTAASSDGVYYRAQLSKADLESLGHYANGSADLVVNGQTQQTIKLIYNIAEPVLDRKIVDTFDTYYGVDGLLNKEWTANSGTGSSITASLDQTKKYDGDSSLKLTYSLTKDSYVGVSRPRETDWSGCNALQLWTIPDGNNQLVVIQVTANGQVYEAYLNEYPAYAGKTTPLLVTIPFAEFAQRDTADHPKGGLVSDCKNVSSVGLWVNTIQNEAVKDGTVSGVIYYDGIQAIENGPSEVTISAFVDVPANAYYAKAVQWAVEKGITSGTSASAFSPNNPCTRAQFVTFLWRAAGSPAPAQSTNPFTDLRTGAYYRDAVLWAVEQGITSGTTASTFSPDATVTRGQAAAFLYRSAGSPKVTVSNTFRDVSASDYYAAAVQWAKEQGVTNGTSETAFSPGNPCTRAQIVTFLYRAQ